MRKNWQLIINPDYSLAVDHEGNAIDIDSLETLLGVEKITWPFIITGAWCIISSTGFAILGLLLNEINVNPAS